MRRLSGSGISGALVAVALLGLGACTKHEEPAPIAAIPPPPPPPLPPPPPSADDQLKARLEQLGAKPSAGGYTVTLASAKFRGGKASFDSDDEATITKIVGLLRDEPQVRVQIEDYTDKRGPRARVQERSQMHANAVLRDLTSQGGDEARIQAQGRVNLSTSPRIDIVFSNAEGEFRPGPLENS